MIGEEKFNYTNIMIEEREVYYTNVMIGEEELNSTNIMLEEEESNYTNIMNLAHWYWIARKVSHSHPVTLILACSSVVMEVSATRTCHCFSKPHHCENATSCPSVFSNKHQYENTTSCPLFNVNIPGSSLSSSSPSILNCSLRELSLSCYRHYMFLM